ncbi:hypothetical protein HF285_04610 [Acidithiobacillus ferrooxidans F221]|uniref:hypothetical protein n=1 Tax=Acidithiobacillus ferrooxidans TaxID=920 RepID=UPI001C069DCD|nr:hypothetical protein [Acidithiobacillus ferrooxidans]MBU2807564.1 hypothetical protein [Acidithiobacillus ferrooxidans F221]
MKEPVSLDLFSPDIFPEVSLSRRYEIARLEFRDTFRRLEHCRLRKAPYGLFLARARVLLDLMGGLGGVW